VNRFRGIISPDNQATAWKQELIKRGSITRHCYTPIYDIPCENGQRVDSLCFSMMMAKTPLAIYVAQDMTPKSLPAAKDYFPAY